MDELNDSKGLLERTKSELESTNQELEKSLEEAEKSKNELAVSMDFQSEILTEERQITEIWRTQTSSEQKVEFRSYTSRIITHSSSLKYFINIYNKLWTCVFS
jgi:hypothetical protein